VASNCTSLSTCLIPLFSTLAPCPFPVLFCQFPEPLWFNLPPHVFPLLRRLSFTAMSYPPLIFSPCFRAISLPLPTPPFCCQPSDTAVLYLRRSLSPVTSRLSFFVIVTRPFSLPISGSFLTKCQSPPIKRISPKRSGWSPPRPSSSLVPKRWPFWSLPWEMLC